MNHVRELDQFKKYLDLRVGPGTTGLYMYVLKQWFASIDGRPPTGKEAQEYIDLLAQSGKSPSTVSTRAHAIMKYFEWKGEPIRLDCPTIRMKEPEYLSVVQIQKLLSVCRTPLEKTLITVLFDTAIRISELLNLELPDIDRSTLLICVTRKGGRREEVNISEKALEVLDEWISARHSESKKVFMGLDYYSAWLMVKAVGKRAKMKLHPHMLRHSRAIQMRKAGATLEDVKDHLGHQSIVTTANIYSRFKAIDLKERIPSW